MNDLSFIHPYWLFLLEILPLMILYYFGTIRVKQPVIAFSSFVDLDTERITLRNRLIHVPFIFRLLAVGLILIALAEPVREKVTRGQDRNSTAVIYVVDITRSMLNHDFLPNRLEAVKISLSHFIGYKGELSGVVLMDSSGHILSPVSTDLDALKNDVQNIEANTALPRPSLPTAIELAAGLLDSIKPGNRSILVVSSGMGETGETQNLLARLLTGRRISLSAITVAGEGTIRSIERKKGKLVYREAISETNDAGLPELCNGSGGSYTRVTRTDEFDQALLRFTINRTRRKTSLNKSQEGIFPFTLLAAILLTAEILLHYTVLKTLP